MKSVRRFGCRKNDIFRLHFTISIIFVAHILVLIGGEKEQPIHLTPMNPQHPIVLPYVGSDQCMLQPGQQNIGSFGLLFRLPRGFLCPDEGLVICYPSQLDPQKTTNGMAAAILYKVGNSNDPKQKEIVDKCCQGQKVCTMHGIRVSTDKARKNIVVELSITTDNYTLPLVDQFWIEFGREENLVTVLRTADINGKKNRRPVSFPLNFALYKAYMNNVGRGAMLGNYAGLWMLGLDILPTEADNEVQFVVHRDCECTMQAWFTRPTDEEDPGQFSNIEIGSNGCKPDDVIVKNKTYDIKSLETNTKIVVWFLPKASTQSVEISLWAENELILSLTIEKQRITYNEKNWDHGAIEILETALLQPGKDGGRMEIHMDKHSYHAVYVENAEKIDNNYWPKREVKKLDECQIRVKTDAYIGRVEKLPSVNEEWKPPKWPYSMRLNHYVTNGTIFHIHGEVHADAKSIEINLMHDAPEWHEYIGATPLQIHVDFEDNSILMQTYHNGKWLGSKTFKEDVNGFKNPFEKGKMFNLEIMMQRVNMTTLYTISVNGTNIQYEGDLPIWTINWLWLKGDMDLLTSPIEYSQEEKSGLFKYELEHLFFEKEELCIIGKPFLFKNESTAFEVYLFHEANEEDPNIGDIILKIGFTFKNGSGDLMSITSKLHETGTGQQLGRSRTKNPIGSAGQVFMLTIKPMPNQFGILINGGEAAKYPGKPDSDMPPSWAVNWLMSSGEAGIEFDNKHPKLCGDKGQKPLPNYIKQVDPYKPLDIGNVITIQGAIKAGNDKNGEGLLHISIGFFREALEWHPIIGQTVLMANFSSQTVEFDTYYNKTWKYKENLENDQQMHTLTAPLEEGHQFSMKVEVKEKEYEIHIGSDKFTYSHKWMPYWAVQYIVVKGDVEEPANNQPPFIQIE